MYRAHPAHHPSSASVRFVRSVLFIWAVVSVTAASVQSALRIESIPPQTTDPAITQWLAPHYVVLDTAAMHRDQLFVFMHGQLGAPGSATELIKTAAMERYFAVGVTYPNDWVPFSLCGDGVDPNCYENLRREILDGVDRSPHISVNQANSFENRLIKLLQYLDGLHPGEGWGQFLAGGSPKWSLMVIWGHSQGGTNAAVLARHQSVARLIMSGQPVDSVPGGFASWWNSHATHSWAYFGFCHTQDQLSSKVAVWNILGMGEFGGVQDVASIPSPYNLSHELSTSVAPAVAGQFHNSVVTDATTPRDGLGEPVYRPVWRYLMTTTTPAGDLNCDGVMNLSDVQAFSLALVNPDDYDAAFPSCDVSRADTNTDGAINGADVRSFVERLLP